jgi:hypothetical protein
MLVAKINIANATPISFLRCEKSTMVLFFSDPKRRPMR